MSTPPQVQRVNSLGSMKPLPDDAAFLKRNAIGLKQAAYAIRLKQIGVRDTQVYVKRHIVTQAVRVQFYDKHTLRQWVLPEAEGDAVMQALPEAMTDDELIALVDKHPAVKRLAVIKRPAGGPTA